MSGDNLKHLELNSRSKCYPQETTPGLKGVRGRLCGGSAPWGVTCATLQGGKCALSRRLRDGAAAVLPSCGWVLETVDFSCSLNTFRFVTSHPVSACVTRFAARDGVSRTRGSRVTCVPGSWPLQPEGGGSQVFVCLSSYRRELIDSLSLGVYFIINGGVGLVCDISKIFDT